MRLDRAHVESGGPYPTGVANCERLPIRRQPSPRGVLGEILHLQTGAPYGLLKRIRVVRLGQVHDNAASVFDFIPDSVGMNDGVARR